MWEVENRIGLLLSYISAIAILSLEYDAGRYLSYISTILAFKSIFINSPTYRIDIHWRSITLYLMNITLSMVSLIAVPFANNHVIVSRTFCIIYSILLIIVSFISTGFYFIFPVPSEAPLTGPYKQIGTTTFNAHIANNIIPVQVWFPLESSSFACNQSIVGHITSIISGSDKALLWTSGHPSYQVRESLELLDTLATLNSLPSFIVKHLILSRTNAIYCDSFNHIPTKLHRNGNCDVNNTDSINININNINNNNISSSNSNVNNTCKFPIAIYSHGLYGWRQIHHSSCENLASHGYIVFACDHCPDSTLTRPIGDNITYTPFNYFCNAPQFTLEERTFYRNGINRRVYDLNYLIDYIKTDEFYLKYPELRDRLDDEIVNVWGHSYGGGTITSLCCRPRCNSNNNNNDNRMIDKKNSITMMNNHEEISDDDRLPLTLPASSSSLPSSLSSLPPASSSLPSPSSSSPYRINAVALDGWIYPLTEQDFSNGLQPNTALLNLSADLWPYGKV